jgi:signal transduction histidine kinase
VPALDGSANGLLIRAATARRARRDPLAEDSPWWEGGFWLLQGAVLGIYLLRMAVEVALVHGAVPDIPDFTTLGLFIWPVLFAAVTFGPSAALVTTAWIAVLSIPREIAYAQSASPVGAWAETTQIAALCIIALVVGRRVTAERLARRRAEAAHRAHVAAEARYRGLFESNAAPILLVEADGRVVEANRSASLTLGPAVRPGVALGTVIGPEPTRRVLATAGHPPALTGGMDRPGAAGDRTGPEDTAGDTTGPDDTAGDTTGPDDTAGDTTGPDDTAGDTTGPNDTAGDNAGPDDTADDPLREDPLHHDTGECDVELTTAAGPLRFRVAATLIEGAGLVGSTGPGILAGEGRELGSGRLVQVVLNDVTADRRRRESIEGYAASVVQAQEDERRHIAQELHDGPLQSLVHLCRRIDEARRGAMEDGAGNGLTAEHHTAERLTDLRRITEALVDELRSISRGLRPSVLDDLGLAAAVGRLVEDLDERGAMSASLGVTGTPRRLPGPVELAMFRVAQEALSNAEHHAAATRVSVGMQFDERGVRLLVSDDGAGFDPSRAGRRGSRGSLGLLGMRERMHVAGGTLTVHSAAGRGTTVEAWSPSPAVPPATGR